MSFNCMPVPQRQCCSNDNGIKCTGEAEEHRPPDHDANCTQVGETFLANIKMLS